MQQYAKTKYGEKMSDYFPRVLSGQQFSLATANLTAEKLTTQQQIKTKPWFMSNNSIILIECNYGMKQV